MDGGHPLQNEAAEKRRHRDGAARARLQYDPCYEPDGYPGDDRGNEGVRGAVRLGMGMKTQG